MWPFHQICQQATRLHKEQDKAVPSASRECGKWGDFGKFVSKQQGINAKEYNTTKIKKIANLSSTFGSESDTDGLVVKSDRSTVQGPLENKARLANCFQI